MHSGHSYMTTLNTPHSLKLRGPGPYPLSKATFPAAPIRDMQDPSAGPEAQLNNRAQPSTCEAMNSVVRDGKSPCQWLSQGLCMSTSGIQSPHLLPGVRQPVLLSLLVASPLGSPPNIPPGCWRGTSGLASLTLSLLSRSGQGPTPPFP